MQAIGSIDTPHRYVMGRRRTWVATGIGGMALAAAIGAMAGLAVLGQPGAPQTSSPFSVGVTEGGGPDLGWVGWLMERQSAFYADLTSTLQGIVDGHGGALWLAGIAFAYGVFHAAGPGHGKAVIAAWMFANERQLRGGLWISAASALLQAMVAITLVGVAGGIIRVTAESLTTVTAMVEAASFAAVACLGAILLARKSVQMAAALSRQEGGACRDASCCGPSPVKGNAPGWRGRLGAVAASGLRPCSGAIVILVFSLTQGAFAVGAMAALAMAAGTAMTTGALAILAVHAKAFALDLAGGRGHGGLLWLRGVEVVASATVCALGLSLAAGAVMRGLPA